ncbi:iron chaperone [Sphingobacterium arenae]|uniref:DUF1801 domain-containing protein n=1 Tax=Sphingobacterium arenae TaxID=1280598 RepID=A0ABR7Y300_9SPHI|nr:DUF1801 domain-containing protein [Sphingobacterium arenae]MBD1425687.1 DUF1801 domain-containing protein [Sphingobacterium arenae]
MKSTVDKYINSFPEDIRETLLLLRQTIKKAIPDAEEKLSYGLPAYHFNGVLLYFGAYKNHIGIYPTPSAIEYFKGKLSEYKIAKGSIQIPNNVKFPYKLIEQIAKFRRKENHNMA